MARLIDADKLFLHLNNWAFAEAPSDLDVGEAKFEREVIYRTINECMQAVDDQPTAYDVDRVIESLRESESYSCSPMFSRGIETAIDKVKRGGVDEQE